MVFTRRNISSEYFTGTAANHTNLSNLHIVLVAPNGDSVTVINNKTTNCANDNLITIFDDNADSLTVSNRFTSFAPSVRPENNLNSVFSSDNAQGYWTIKVRDNAASDTGRLYAWGIQINNMTEREKNLNLAALMQGFYSDPANSMIRDNMRAYLLESFSNAAKRFFNCIPEQHRRRFVQLCK